MLLAGPISLTSTQYIDFVDFLHFTGLLTTIENKDMFMMILTVWPDKLAKSKQ